MARFDLSDEEWAVIEPLLPATSRGPERKGDPNVLNGIFYVLRTGAPWRDLPERYGPFTTVYNRYVRWGKRGVWQRIFETLATECEDTLNFIDSWTPALTLNWRSWTYRKPLILHVRMCEPIPEKRVNTGPQLHR